MNRVFGFLVLMTAISPLFFACSREIVEWQIPRQSASHSMLKPGEKIDDMTITTGVEDAVPLWSFCLPTIESEYMIRVDCRELNYPRLAIGHTYGIMDLVSKSAETYEFTWQMAVDGHPIDLKAFGVHDYVQPDLAPSPSPIREIFRVLRVWDVVLENLTPGVHTLHGQARSEKGIYHWIVNFTVAGSSDN